MLSGTLYTSDFKTLSGRFFFYERVLGKLSRQDKNMGAVMDQ